MINVETFKEMLEHIDDNDFILKVTQAEVLLVRSPFPTPEEMDPDTEPNAYIDRVVRENAYTGVKLRHYRAMCEITEYENLKVLAPLGTGLPLVFPDLSKYLEKKEGPA